MHYHQRKNPPTWYRTGHWRSGSCRSLVHHLRPGAEFGSSGMRIRGSLCDFRSKICPHSHDPLSKSGYAGFKLQGAKYISALIHHDIHSKHTLQFHRDLNQGRCSGGIPCLIRLVSALHRRFLGIDMRYCRRPKSYVVDVAGRRWSEASRELPHAVEKLESEREFHDFGFQRPSGNKPAIVEHIHSLQSHFF